MAFKESGRKKKTPFIDIAFYSTGDGAFSLTMNGISAFSMLFYTQALGLDYKLAGLALSVSVFWDAITDPIMGFLSDQTRSRFGRRHMYILVGGLALAASFYFLWTIPGGIAKSGYLFWYLLIMNILIRTAVTVFYIPFLALGFEICRDYHERSILQGARSTANMIANMLGPALAWYLFFKDVGDVPSTNVVSNYQHMGTAFSIATVVLVLIVTLSTRKYIVDSRQGVAMESTNIAAFFHDVKEILRDKYSQRIYAFYALINQGCVLVASLQMYLYVYFMNFSSGEKAIAHGGTMMGFAIGSVLCPILARRLDKKRTALFGAGLSIVGNFLLVLFFTTGVLSPTSTLSPAGVTLPIAIITFVICHGLYWMGNGILMPMTFSMVADTAEINNIETGVLKDGSYGAMFSFLGKLSLSVGLFISGNVLGWIGFVSGAATQSPQAIKNLTIATFWSGILFAGLAIIAFRKYPVDKAFMEAIRQQGGKPALRKV